MCCSECGYTYCHPRCPNAPDPPIVYYCDLCNEVNICGECYTCKYFEERKTPIKWISNEEWEDKKNT